MVADHAVQGFDDMKVAIAEAVSLAMGIRDFVTRARRPI